MMKYNLPADLDNEIDQLEALIKKYRSGEASQTELKAHRVPFGVYEQREPDTYMVRIRCAAGAVTPDQLEGIGAIASKYGVGDIHVTSRQELQIHYVKLDDIVSIIRDIKKLGLATRGGGGNTVRNIIAPDDAGIDPDEEFDVSPYAFALTSRLIAESDSWNLPRKYKIAFSGSPEDKGYATISDLGFIAKVKNGKKGFRVYAAGGMGAKSATSKLLFDFIEDGEVYPVAKAMKNVFFKFGNRKNKHAARSRFLWDSLGGDEFKRKFHEEYSKIIKEGFTPLAVNETEDKAVTPLVPQEEPEDTTGFTMWKSRFAKEQ
ncbi:MAG: nitrite/sulfite reductase, partial [Candidatus Omnitrophota bacterium]|nr:nitrite/sulfite reductase [Candidatus Omnitrophota bacterium]